MLETDRRAILGFAALAPFLPSVTALAATPAAAGAAAGAPPAWDLADLYPDFAAWDAARGRVLAALPRLRAYSGTLSQSAAAMAKALSGISDVGKEAERIQIYASLKGDEDLRVAANQERLAQSRDMAAALGEATAWSDPEIVAIGKDRVESFIAADPALKSRFAFSLRDTLRQGAHVLDVQGETLLAAADPVLSGPQEISQQLLHADIPWPTVILSDGRTQRLDDQGYTLTRDASVRADRKKVFDTFWATYGQYRNSLGASLLAKVKGDVFVSKARHYPSSLTMALSGDNVPEGVYRTLVAATDEGLAQLHRYFELRRRMLKLPDIHYYDIYPPLVTLDRKFTVPEMRTITLEAVKPLGPDYGALLAKSTAARWMDPLSRPGKASGAYMSGGAYDVHPYLLLNLDQNYEGPALRDLGIFDVHRRDRLDLQRGAAGRIHDRACPEPRGEAVLPRPETRGPARDLFPPDDVRRVRAQDPRSGRSGGGAVWREIHRALPRSAQALPRPRVHHRRCLRGGMGLHSALLPLLLRLPVRDLDHRGHMVRAFGAERWRRRARALPRRAARRRKRLSGRHPQARRPRHDHARTVPPARCSVRRDDRCDREAVVTVMRRASSL
jgi:Peptidase family M3/Oligopeptidase F